MLFRALFIVLAVVAVLSVIVALIRKDWIGAARRARHTGSDAAAKGAAATREAAGEWAERGKEVAGRLTDRAEHASQSVSERLHSHLDGSLDQALVLTGASARLAEITRDAIADTAVWDETPARTDEYAAWSYEAMGRCRLALQVHPSQPGAALLGVTDYDVVAGRPQGGQVTEHALKLAEERCQAAAIPVTRVRREFSTDPSAATAAESEATYRVRPLA